jgi:hypothetical protein
MKKILLAFVLAVLYAAGVHAQAIAPENFPAFIQGQPSANPAATTDLLPCIESGVTTKCTPQQLMQLLNQAEVNNALGYSPVNRAGDTMSGPLVTPASTALGAGLILPQGTAPVGGALVNGSIWITPQGLFVQAGGVTFGPIVTTVPTGTTGATVPTNNGGFVQSGTANFTGPVQIASTSQSFPTSGIIAGTSDSQTFAKQQKNTPVTLTDAATITWDMTQGNIYKLAISGNRIMGNPNPGIGQCGLLEITNVNGTSSITAWGTGGNTAYTAPGGTSTLTLTQTVNAVDVIGFCSVDGTTVRLSITNNYAH